MGSFKNDIENLAAEINKHDYHYYALDNPTISDLEYDKKYRKLVELETKHNYTPKNSPTQRVGGFVSSKFEKSSHKTPMLSIQNCFSDEEIRAFDLRVRKLLALELKTNKLEYFCQPKLDGLAMELIYKNGELSKAITRGDGVMGENVTENIKTIRCVPLSIANAPKLLEVRGEVIMKKSEFSILNKRQQEEGLPVFSTPRNAAAGSVRQLNSSVTAERKLFFYAYECGSFEGISFKTHQEMESLLRELGIPIMQVRSGLQKKSIGSDLSYLAPSLDKAIAFRNFIYDVRKDIDFDVDGIVIKVNRLDFRKKIGRTTKYPKWACAAKFKAEEAKTKIVDIKAQVGRTGVVTPVAVLDPVKVSGVTITHASLHNQDEMDKKDIRMSDTVYVQRAGDVIPYITGVDFSKRKKGALKYLLPNKCPVCKSRVDKSETLARCTNQNCPSIIKETLKHFVSRRAMNMDKLGDKLIDKLFDAGLVKRYYDFFKLKEKHILSLEGYKDKSAKNIISSIENSRKQKLDRFIYSLGIRHVGENTAKLIARYFKNVESMLDAKEADFFEIDGVGEKTSEAIFQYLSDGGRKEIKELLNMIELENKTYSSKGSVVLTGKLTKPKHDIKEILEEYGYNILGSVSKNTDFVLFGDKAGSKLSKAKKLNIKIIDESSIDWQKFKGSLKKL